MTKLSYRSWGAPSSDRDGILQNDDDTCKVLTMFAEDILYLEEDMGTSLTFETNFDHLAAFSNRSVSFFCLLASLPPCHMREF